MKSQTTRRGAKSVVARHIEPPAPQIITGAPTRVPPAAWIAAGICLMLFVLQAWFAAREDSVTIDEFVHLPVGLYMLRTHDFAPDPINPPVTRMIAALPLWILGVHFEPAVDAGHWGMGYLFMQEHAASYQSLYVQARGMIIALSCALGVLVFYWAAQLYGPAAGVAAVLLFAFSPEMLAHGHLVTLDMAGALGLTATAYAVWRLLSKPDCARAVITGAVLGVATLLKLSGVTMLAAAAVAVVVSTLTDARGRHGGSLMLLRLAATAAAAAVVVVDAGYGFQGLFARLDQASFHPGGMLASMRAALPWLRLPLPLPFLNGVDLVMTTGIASEPQYFLAGEWSARGWWYYHVAAFALKTPLPLIIAAVAAIGTWIAGRAPGARSYCVFIPILFIFLFNSLFNSQDIGVRHVLPAYPLLFIAVAPLLAQPLAALAQGIRTRAVVLRAAAVALGTLWFAAGSLWVAPRYLQYFNELAGGPGNGHRYLVDSNIDWGQDLLRLKRYMDANQVSAVNLAYFGRVHPGVYGIAFQPLTRENAHGPTVVSASFLMGRPYFWFSGDEIRWIKSGTYTWLQSYRPVARIGALFVYDLP